MTGVYKITNLINNKVYVGRSVDIKMRWLSHKRNYNSRNTMLYKDMRKYGFEQFKFEILEKCNEDQLDKKEKQWIKKLDSYKNGYNMTMGVNNRINECILDEITTLLIANNLTIDEIAEHLTVNEHTILAINYGSLFPNKNICYPIRNLDEKYFKLCLCGTSIDINLDCCSKCHDESFRTTKRPSREIFKDLIRYKSFLEIGRIYKVTDNAIRKWCLDYQLPRTKKEINQYNDDEWINM